MEGGGWRWREAWLRQTELDEGLQSGSCSTLSGGAVWQSKTPECQPLGVMSLVATHLSIGPVSCVQVAGELANTLEDLGAKMLIVSCY